MAETNLTKVHISRGDEKATPDKASTGALSRWLETDKQRLRVVTYPTGYEADHVCYDGHSFYITEGSIKMEVGEEVVEWKEGDAFIIPDDVPHRVFNPFASDAKVIVVDNV
ncbi:cupin domain-containing protein [Bacillus piscicola]|uniref:cupin domain-containing protein n=1 Tax=Bacillus piscicola TaxID=1632684 RepID=UPI001F08946A|nr:cupin domain-containing protein [Bacillus piscicola]